MKINNPLVLPDEMVINNVKEWEQAKKKLTLNGYNKYISGRGLNYYEDIMNFPFYLLLRDTVDTGKYILTSPI